ncbi:MAG: MFS transporter, partial [Bdellovibrionota bacterium]
SMAMVTSTVQPETRGSFMSVNTSVQSLSQAAGSLLAGIIVYQSASGRLENFTWAGYFAIAMTLIAIPIGRSLKGTEN